MKRDEKGLVVQLDGDGGDTLANQSRLVVGLSLTNRAFAVEECEKILQHLWVDIGIYRRHWDKSKWYSDPCNVSRDQLIPLIMALSVPNLARYDQFLKQLIWRIVCRGFFAQNTKRGGADAGNWKLPDSMIPCISVMIRALNSIGFGSKIIWWPMLLVTDIMLVIGSWAKNQNWRWNDARYEFEKVDPDKVDDWADVMIHLQAIHNLPTPFSYWARRIYSKREINYGNTKKGEKNAVMGALVWYCRTEAQGNMELAELFRSEVEHWF